MSTAALTISTVDTAQAAKVTPVMVRLCDSNGVEVTNGTDSAQNVVARVYGKTDATGALTLQLIPNAEITPANTYYTVVAGHSITLISKTSATQTLTAARVVSPAALGLTAVLDNLGDVSAASPSTNDGLVWNGTAWVASAVASAASVTGKLDKAANLGDVANAAAALASLGGASTSYVDQHAPHVVSVIAYGADSTGASDSSTAFTNALAAGAGTVYVPAGTYKISADVSWPVPNTTVFQPSPCLVGEGPTKTKLQVASSAKINVTAPTVAGTGSLIAGTQFLTEIRGIKFEGSNGGTCLYLQRYFNLKITDCWFDKKSGSQYGFDTCILNFRKFQTTGPREDDLNIDLLLKKCFFFNYSVGYDDIQSSSPMGLRFDSCYFQGQDPTTLATTIGSYATFKSHGIRTCANHLVGTTTYLVSNVIGVYLDQGPEALAEDVLPKGAVLTSWHFEGQKTADVHIERCLGLTLVAPFVVDHNANDTSWIPRTIDVADNASGACYTVTVSGAAIFPPTDATYGPNWRMVYAGTALQAASYVKVDASYFGTLATGAAVVDMTATNPSRVIFSQGVQFSATAQVTNILEARITSDTAARVAFRPQGVGYSGGGGSGIDSVLTRTLGANKAGVLQVVDSTGVKLGSVQVPVVTGANLIDATHYINTFGKYQGRIAFDSTTGQYVMASAGASGDTWLFVYSGQLAYTPGGSAATPAVTFGATFLGFADQSSDPSAPTAGVDLYAKATAGRDGLWSRGSILQPRRLHQKPIEKQYQYISALSGSAFRTEGVGGNAATTGTVAASDQGRAGGRMQSITSAASLSADANLAGTALWYRGATTDLNAGFSFQARCLFPDASYDETGATTGSRIFVGMGAVALGATARGGAASFACFNRENVNASNKDANWQFVTGDGTTDNVADTGLVFTATHQYLFDITCAAGGAAIYWTITDLTAGTAPVSGSSASNLPAVATALAPIVELRTINATARIVTVRHLYAESDIG